MDILIMGECSQTICKEFFKKGHNVLSCDLQESYGDLPERHIVGDMFEVFYSAFYPKLPDRVIVHPTCTYMANSGALRLYIGGKKINGVDVSRWGKMVDSANEFKRILALPCEEIVVENPIMHCHAKNIIKVRQSQVIQPYQFGHPESKATCLWVKGLPLLKPTNTLSMPECGHWDNTTKSGRNKLTPDRPGQEGKRARERSKTYEGIAKAMADQWG